MREKWRKGGRDRERKDRDVRMKGEKKQGRLMEGGRIKGGRERRDDWRESVICRLKQPIRSFPPISVESIKIRRMINEYK